MLNRFLDTKEKMLDFYADLKGMPKWSDPSSQAAAGEADDGTTDSVSGSTVSKPLTRRKEARMENKKKMLVKMQETQNNTVAEKEKVGTVRSFEEVEGGDMELRERKRTKSMVENSGDVDIEMKA
jgi:tRNA (guanine-N(7)-)-methyltransferase subunit TRM82